MPQSMILSGQPGEDWNSCGYQFNHKGLHQLPVTQKTPITEGLWLSGEMTGDLEMRYISKQTESIWKSAGICMTKMN